MERWESKFATSTPINDPVLIPIEHPPYVSKMQISRESCSSRQVSLRLATAGTLDLCFASTHETHLRRLRAPHIGLAIGHYPEIPAQYLNVIIEAHDYTPAFVIFSWSG
jgi:hypothetical protein